MKMQATDKEKFFAMLFSDKGFVYRIYIYFKLYKLLRKIHIEYIYILSCINY